jgi:sugar/nucleoside kinase (ribokinase family)
MESRLLVYGDVGIDIHIRTTYQPKIGEDAKVEEILFQPGGSAANCAAITGRLGIPTTFIGFVGKDQFGESLKKDLKGHGVSTKYVFTVEGNSGITIAIREALGERTFYSYRGVNADGELPKISMNKFSDCTYLHISGYSFQNENSRKNVQYLMKMAKQSNTLISLDPSYWFSREYYHKNPEILSEIDIIFPNQEEVRLITGFDDPIRASKMLLDMGPKTVIIKLGPEGSYVASSNEAHHLPAIENVEVIDSTGAGDAFCGGFIFGKVIGLGNKESAIIGNIISSNIITHIGGHSGAPSCKNLTRMLREAKEKQLAEKLSAWFKNSLINRPN